MKKQFDEIIFDLFIMEIMGIDTKHYSQLALYEMWERDFHFKILKQLFPLNEYCEQMEIAGSVNDSDEIIIVESISYNIIDDDGEF